MEEEGKVCIKSELCLDDSLGDGYVLQTNEIKEVKNEIKTKDLYEEQLQIKAPETINFSEVQLQVQKEIETEEEFSEEKWQTQKLKVQGKFSKGKFQVKKETETKEKLSEEQLNIPEPEMKGEFSEGQLRVKKEIETKEELSEKQLQLKIHSRKAFMCGSCGQLFLDDSSLFMHLRNAHGVSASLLPNGGKNSKDLDLQRNSEHDLNQETHNVEQLGTFCRKQCPVSTASTSRGTKMAGKFTQSQSFNVVVSLSDEFTCTMCNKTFTSEWRLKIHMRDHKGENVLYECDVCNKLFAWLGFVRTHMRKHSGEKPYKCTMCNKRFTQSGNLTSHLKTHTGEKAFRCTVCGKSFAWAKNLNDHIRTHTGEKPYKCTSCDKAFSRSENLSVHIRTHKGEKTHKCTWCEKAKSRGLKKCMKKTQKREKS